MFNNLFNTSPAVPNTPAPAPAPAPAEPGNLPAAGDPNALAPAGVASAPEVAAPEGNSPLAEYKDMWDTIPNQEADAPMTQKLDPVKLQQAIAKSDFSTVITPENLAAIAAGGDEATKAFASSMNQVSQQVMNQSVLASNKMIEQAIERVNTTWEAKLPALLKKQNLNESVASADPIFSNPAVKPIMEATQLQLAAKYPND